MSPKICFFFIISSSLLIGVSPVKSENGCTVKNITCTEIEDDAGNFIFHFEMPNATDEIEINQNGSKLAQGKLIELDYSSDIVHFDNTSVKKRTCQNFFMKFITQEANQKISECCVFFNTVAGLKAVTDPPPTPTPKPSPPWEVSVGVPLGVVLVCIAVFCCCRRKRETKGCGFYVPVFNRESQERSVNQKAEQENRVNSLQEEENLLNDDNQVVNVGNSEDISISMDNISDTSEDKDVPQVKTATPQEGQNGNMGHDPGGGKANRRRLCSNDLCLNEGTLGGQRSDKDKEQQSPHSQRSAGPGFEERTGEEDPMLVNSSGRCSDRIKLPLDDEKGATTE